MKSSRPAHPGRTDELVLQSSTSPRWLALAAANIEQVLVDHAHCEKKAAAHALSLLQSYPEVPGLALKMARLAREESSHLARVLACLEERGIPLTSDPGDPYVQKLLAQVRKTARERRLDRLLVAAIIEARSCERLGILGQGLAEPALRKLYQELSQSEEGHQRLFVRLAFQAHGEQDAVPRLRVLLEWESKILDEVGLRAAIH
jgi:tRNA-(ms[2]io[6]A)-hydroxylase